MGSSVTAYMPQSVTDDWSTPIDLFQQLNAQHDFDIDVAASLTNHLCDEWLGLDHPDESKRNGLTAEWFGHVCLHQLNMELRTLLI